VDADADSQVFLAVLAMCHVKSAAADAAGPGLLGSLYRTLRGAIN